MHLDEDERELLDRLHAGDEEAFEDLVVALSPAMIRVARLHVADQATAGRLCPRCGPAIRTKRSSPRPQRGQSRGR